MRRVHLLLCIGVSACGGGDAVFVPAPSFGPEIQSVFYAVLAEDLGRVVYGAPAHAPVVQMEAEDAFPPDSLIFAMGDVFSLESHGIEAGVVSSLGLEDGRPLPPLAVQRILLQQDPPVWQATSLPEGLKQFRFTSNLPSTRCASLELLAEYPYEDLLGELVAWPTLVPLDEERLLVIGGLDDQGFVLTPTSSQAVQLGLSEVPRVPRALYRAPSGEIFMGGSRGEVYRGDLETGLRLATTLDVPPGNDPGSHDASFRALTGSRRAEDPFEVFGTTFRYFFALEPEMRSIYTRDPIGSGRQVGGAVWLAPGHVVFTLDDERWAYELRDGVQRQVLSTIDVGGMDYVEGFGAVAVTWDGRMYKMSASDDEFELLAEEVTSRDVYIAGNAERIFVLAEIGRLDQFVPGEPLCPPMSQNKRAYAQVVVYGRYMAKAGSFGVEIWEMVTPD